MAGMSLAGAGALIDGFDEMVETLGGSSSGYVMGTNVPYSVHQELGTSSQPGTPHVRPGMDATYAKMGRLALQADDVDEWLRLTALQWLRETKVRAPTDTGNLKSSYQVDEL